MVSSFSDVQQSTAPSMSPSLYLTFCMEEIAGGSSCSNPRVAAAGEESSPAEEELLTLLLIELLVVHFFSLFLECNILVYNSVDQNTAGLCCTAEKMIQNEVHFFFFYRFLHCSALNSGPNLQLLQNVAARQKLNPEQQQQHIHH